MSNALRFDSLLLRATARVLEERLRGRTVRGIWLDRKDRALLIRIAARTRKTPDTWLFWHVHPTAGDLVLDEAEREPRGSTVQVAPGTHIAGITALPDERIVCIALDVRDAAAGFARNIYIELIGSRWNAIATGENDTIVALLQVRERDGVMLRPGARYNAPQRTNRAGALTQLMHDEFAAQIAALDADEDVRRGLVKNVAYMSGINATYVAAPLVTVGGDAGVTESYRRYAELLTSHTGFVLNEGRGQPYPGALGQPDAEKADDLIDAFARVRKNVSAETSTPPVGTVEAAQAAVHERIRRIAERVERLVIESRDAQVESERLRHEGDLLFAQLHAVTRGMKEVDLDDFAGGRATIKLDATLSPKENASALHEQAKRREHAAERVPAMIEEAQRERADLEALQHRLSNGEATATEIQHWARAATSPHADDAPVLPYRVHRTSSGLEVRVGKNSRANDDLTFHHSAPDDIWLHARDYAGAHVVLRWGKRESNPSVRDIEEAAILAATHSRGRTSGLVPVDWTRRKYVRKKRKAPPGQVVVERAKTVFVTPDAR